MNTRSSTLMVVAIAIVAGSLVVVAAQNRQADEAAVALQRAIRVEVVEGDLTGAIALYETVVTRHAAERGIVAQALVRLGGCYERLGMREARAAYERVVREFGDQADPATLARTRLAVMAETRDAVPSSTATGAGPRATRLLSASDSAMFPDDFVVIALAPDGRRVAYARLGDQNGVPALMVRDLTSGDTARLSNQGVLWVRRDETSAWRYDRPGHGSINALVWSPDGRRVAFTAAGDADGPGSVLWIADADGERTAAQAATAHLDLRVFDWSPTSDALLCRLTREDGTRALVTVDPSGGAVVPLVDSGWDRGSAVFSPDGRFVAYSTVDNGIGAIDVLSIDGTSRRRVTADDVDGGQPLWAPDGTTLAYQSAGATWAIPVDAGAPAGAPRILRDGPSGQTLGAPYGHVVGWTAAGGFSYVDNNDGLAAYRIGVDPEAGESSGVVEPLEGVSKSAMWFRWSPDMTRVAFTDWIDSGSLKVYSTASRALHSVSLRPVRAAQRLWWSADGGRVFVEPWAESNKTVVAVDVAGGTTEPLFPPLGQAGRLHLSPDGARLIYYQGTNAAPPGRRLVVRDLETGAERVLAQEWDDGGRFAGYVRPAFSPDGRRVLFGRQEYDDGWRSGLWVVSTDATDVRQIAAVETAEGTLGRVIRYSVWDPTGQYVAYSDGHTLFVADVATGRNRRIEVPAEWEQVEVHDWSSDGRWIGVKGGSVAAPELWTVRDILGRAGR